MQHDAGLLECLSFTAMYSFFHIVLSKLRSYPLLLPPRPKNPITLPVASVSLHIHIQYIIFIYLTSHSLYVCARAAILSGLRSLQEKIRKLELEKRHAELSLRSLGKDATHTHNQSEKITQRLLNNQTDTLREMSDPSNCNQG